MLHETDSGNALVKTFTAAQDVDLDPKVVKRHVATVQLRNPDRILLGGHDELRPRRLRLIDEIDDLLLGLAVVVGGVVAQHQFGA